MKKIIKYLWDNTHQINSSIISRNPTNATIDRAMIEKLAMKRTEHIERINALRHERNTSGGGREIREQISMLERELAIVEGDIMHLFIMLPNIIEEDTYDNDKILKSCSAERERKSIKYTHASLYAMHSLTTIDNVDRRFAPLTDNIALLSYALRAKLSADRMLSDYKYCEIPAIIDSMTMHGTGQLPRLESSLFSINGTESWYLIPTGEISLFNISHRMLSMNSKLPIKLWTISSCFRNETSHKSSQNAGLVRCNEFTKIENVIQCNEADRKMFFEELINNFTTVMKELNLDYRVVIVGTKNMSYSAFKQCDIEVWFPASKRWIELASISDCGVYQNLRYAERDDMISLNGTQLAIGRTIAAILENYQNEEGDIIIPEVLKPWIKKDILKVVNKEIIKEN